MDVIRPSRAKAYFEKIRLPENGSKFLEGLTGSDTSVYESEFLDFKGGQGLSSRSDDLTRLWAKNLSCFANSDGGVVIFGIDAPAGKAKGLSLVEDVAGLQRRLKELLPTITEPPVQRVEIESYESPVGSNEGFVVCYIPESPWRPHQSKLSGQPAQFYIRAADNCVPCSVSMLRALFAPQAVSGLEVRFKIHSWVNPYKFKEAALQTWIFNAGPATASEVFASCEYPDFTPDGVGCDQRIWTLLGPEPHRTVTFARWPIHPHHAFQFLKLQLGNCDSPDWRRECRFSISARNQAPLNYWLSLNTRDALGGTEGKAQFMETAD
jgi:hypothetical protein